MYYELMVSCKAQIELRDSTESPQVGRTVVKVGGLGLLREGQYSEVSTAGIHVAERTIGIERGGGSSEVQSDRRVVKGDRLGETLRWAGA